MESTAKLTIIKLLFSLTISSTKQKESFTENSLAVTQAILDTKNFAKLYVVFLLQKE